MLTEADALADADLDALRDLGGAGVLVHLGDPRGRVRRQPDRLRARARAAGASYRGSAVHGQVGWTALTPWRGRGGRRSWVDGSRCGRRLVVSEPASSTRAATGRAGVRVVAVSRADRRAPRRRGAAAAGVVRRDPAGRAGAAGQADLQPVPAAGRDRTPGLDVSGLDGVHRGRPGRPDRRRAGHVHLRGPRRRDAAARPDARWSCPQLRTITLGGAVTGLGIESTSVPQRAAARVGARDGRPHRRRRGRHRHARRRARRPVRHLPQLLRLARLRHPAADRARAGAGVRRAAPRPLRRRRAAGQDRRRDHRDRASTTGERVDGLDGVAFAPGRVLPDPGPLDRRSTGGAQPSATTPASRSTTARSSERRDRPADDLRLPLALGHRLVLVLAAPSALQHPVVRRLWPRRWRRSDVYHRLVGLDRRFGIADRLDRRAGRPRASASSRTSRCRSSGSPEFLDWFDERSGCARCGCARCAAHSRAWPHATRWSRARPTSTSASGAPCTSAPRRPTAR